MAVKVKTCVGEKALNVTQAKKLLGWQEETEKERFGSDFLLRDLQGKKIRCNNNLSNRPLYSAVWKTLKQEILNKRWRFNGEPIIVGEDGAVLNGQHQMVALVLADQERSLSGGKWDELWSESPTIDKLVVLGVSEDDAVVNTMDTCKPRTLADVVFRSDYFQDITAKDRKTLSNMLNYAMRLVWHRTGASVNAFAPRKTHAEMLSFLESHPKLIEAVKHVWEEEGDSRRLSVILSPGYVAGILYLMGTETSDDADNISYTSWEKACDFIVEVAGEDPKLVALRKERAELAAEGVVTLEEKLALVVKAWQCYRRGKAVTRASLKLKYAMSEDGEKKLAELPIVGGLDYGEPSGVEEEKIQRTKPEEIEERKTEIRNENDKRKKKVVKKTPSKGSKKKKRSSSSLFSPGKLVWVANEEQDPWRGRIVSCEQYTCQIKILQGFQGAGNTVTVPRELLQRKQPTQ